MNLPVLELSLNQASDVSLARHYARRLAALAGLSIFDQTRFATSVAAIAQNARIYAGGGAVEFSIDQTDSKQIIQATVVDHGPGIARLDQVLHDQSHYPTSGLGIAGVKKLVDQFSIHSSPESGTVVVLGKYTSPESPKFTTSQVRRWTQDLGAEQVPTEGAFSEQQRNDLIEALEELRRTESSLKTQLRQIQELNQRLDVLSLVASQTDNAVIITDAQGCIEWVNDGFTRMTGYTALEARGKKPGKLLQCDETDPDTVSRIRQKLSQKESFTEEILNQHKNGRAYWVSMNIFPIFDEAGVVNRFIAIESDITKHRRTEQQLHSAKNAAESLNRAKNEFLANISHEIRTPMNAIIGMTELCLDTPLSVEQRDYLLTVHDASNSLLRLLNDILDFSKMEAGKFSINSAEMNLRECLETTIKTLSLRAQEKGIDFATELADDIPENLVGDAARLRQIFVNLIGNAIKFTEQGRILVQGCVQSRTADAVVLQFTVADTGVGIPLEQQKDIFAAFTQADSSPKRRFGGTGLGLAITSQLIEHMHGTISVESTPPYGTAFQFTVRLGLTKSPRPEAPSELAAARVLENQAVLVVGPDVTKRYFVKRILRKWRMQPIGAFQGEEAVQIVKANIRQSSPEAKNQNRIACTTVDHCNSRVHEHGHAAENSPRSVSMLVSPRLDQLATLTTPISLVLIHADLLNDENPVKLAQRIRDLPGFAGTVALLFTSEASQRHLADALEAGIGCYQGTYPLDSQQLLKTILTAQQQSQQQRRTALASPRRILRILLVEDTLANQKLAKRILEKRGHRVSIATNGLQAVERLRPQLLEHPHHEPIDLVLMDIQMPVMDGLEATSTIRRLETVCPQRLPIVAMTAHAMTGDRERCLAAGMDHYLTKPLDARELIKTVEDVALDAGPNSAEPGAENNLPAEAQATATLVVPTPTVAAVSGPAAEPAYHDASLPVTAPASTVPTLSAPTLSAPIVSGTASSAPACTTPAELPSPASLPCTTLPPLEAMYDFQPALNRLEGDYEIFCELVGFYLRDAPTLLTKIQTAITTDDAHQLMQVAHRLRGLVSNFDAAQAVDLTGKLEQSGRDQNLGTAQANYQQLQQEITQLSTALRSFCQIKD